MKSKNNKKMEEEDSEYEYIRLSSFELYLPLVIGILSLGITGIVGYIMFKVINLNSNEGQYEFMERLVDASIWLFMGIFFYFLHVRLTTSMRNVMELKTVSLFAGLALLAKLVVMVIEDIPVLSGGGIFTIYHGLEYLVWVLLTVFFFLYWWRMHDFDLDTYADFEGKDDY